MVGESEPSRKDQFPLHFEQVWDFLVGKVYNLGLGVCLDNTMSELILSWKP